ncbi:MAG: patatin-like phospholipase family protein [Anaerolineales bacterium]|nr:patatin-like phospholipase family protein [Anaerolineales bacterium]
MDTIRALVLSGGGGRGAFHAGVYKYLMESKKVDMDSNHQGIWDPQVVVGTSIGAVNGAAIVQGMSAEELERVWLSLEEHDVQGLPPGMRGLARWMSRRIFADIMDARLLQVPAQEATSPIPKDYWPPLPLLPSWLGERLIGHWINLLDTGPLRKTLYTRFGFDEQKLAESAKALLIAATNVQTGERMMFSNREIYRRDTGEARRDVATGITADRILASCSIPLVYPWTFDPETNAFYWDGAVVANTPLGAALDMTRDVPVDVPAEVVVVLMTPWWQDPAEAPGAARRMPASFGDAITWALDWALLASFRERLQLIEAYNRFAERERIEGKGPYRYRMVKVVVVAPDDFLPAARIIDYDGDVSRDLIEAGRLAAERAFQQEFS